MTLPTFSARLQQAVRQRRSPLVVGLDPRREMLPESLRSQDSSPEQTADAYRTFCCEIIGAVAPIVPAVKPQMAFFEQLGPPGLAALAQVIQAARQANLLVILDGKRNDIGSTAQAYASAYLGERSPWQADSLTVSPYLGQDSLEPFVRQAREHQAGLFVLVKTSNPGSAALQDSLIDGLPLYRTVAQWVESWSAESVALGPASARRTGRSAGGAEPACRYGEVGAVVGATYPQQLAELREAMPHCWLLVPGLGAQGATAADVASAFDPQGTGAVVNSSRAIIFAYRQQAYAHFPADRWLDAVTQAAVDTSAQLRAETPAGNL